MNTNTKIGQLIESVIDRNDVLGESSPYQRRELEILQSHLNKTTGQEGEVGESPEGPTVSWYRKSRGSIVVVTFLEKGVRMDTGRSNSGFKRLEKNFKGAKGVIEFFSIFH